MIFLDANLPSESLRWLLQKAAMSPVPLSLDPVSAPKAAKLPQTLEGIDILFPDIREAEAITRLSWQGRSSCEKIWNHLQERGLKKLVLSMGSEGLFAATDQASQYLPALSVPVQDVTGAGDALAAGVLWGQQQQLPFFEACVMGLRNAALSVQTEETVFSKLTPDRLLV